VVANKEQRMMSLVRVLGYTSLACGCLTGHYRELATSRELTYIEEKGTACAHHGHRRNHTLAPTRFGTAAAGIAAPAATAKAS
jgi:hypothetical protein